MSLVQLDPSISLASFQTANQKPKIEDFDLPNTQFSKPTYFNKVANNNTSLILVTVPGQGIHLYEILQQQHIGSWAVPSDSILYGAAKINIDAFNSKTSFIKHSITKKSKISPNGNLHSEVGSESGVETDLSSAIDTKAFHLLDNGYYLYAIIANQKNKSKVLETKKVWIWKDGTKKTEVKFDFDIQDIYPLGHDTLFNNMCLIAFKNGNISLYNSDLNKAIVSISTPGSIVWANHFSTADTEFLPEDLKDNYPSCLITLLKRQDKHDLFLFGLNKTSTGEFGFNILTCGEINPSLFSEGQIIFHTASGRLCSLGIDNKLNCIQILFDKSLISKNQFPIPLKYSSIINLTLQNIQTSVLVSPNSITSSPPISFISSDHLLILGSEADEENELLKSKLLLWDIQLGVLLQEVYLSEISTKKPWSKGQTFCFRHQLAQVSINDMIISAVEYPGSASTSSNANIVQKSTTELLLTPFKCPPKSSLLSSINRLDSTFKYLPPNLPKDKQAQLIYPSSKLPLTIKDQKVYHIAFPDELCNVLINELESSTNLEASFFKHIYKFHINNFNEIDQKYRKTHTLKSKDIENFYYPSADVYSAIPAEEARAYSSKLLNQLKSNWIAGIDKDFLLSYSKNFYIELSYMNLVPPRYIASILKKLISTVDGVPDMTKYSPKVMFLLILSSKISSSMFKAEHGGLLPILIQRQDWFNIQFALGSVKDLSEEELVLTLKASHERYLEEFENNMELSKEAFKAHLINVLYYNFDYKLIIYSLPILNDKEIEDYLRLISNILKEQLTNTHLLFSGSTLFIKVYELFTAILDVHFTVIISNENIFRMLQKTQKFINSKINSLKNFNSFEPVLLPFLKVKKAKETGQISSLQKTDSKADEEIAKEILQKLDAHDVVYRIERFSLF